ncbi:MAG TPA: tRNA (N6-threonylcarbamoyladenosine(37)-N6)-methyltransferase TrmO [Clostridiales bacterium]|nr:tRNA (N6-threonylcarbamoyladenosine(37)-N6)-methyltransferase TrmO [Clostridiales bacterium]
MQVTFSEIGYVDNDVEQQIDENWGSVCSRIVLKDEYRNGLKGLEEFSHILVITYLHESKFSVERHLQRRPRNLSDMPLVGIFSQRAKDRPNPIGVTAVKIIEVNEESLVVEGLDAIKGTPVLDIKPYYPVYDIVQNARVPEWVERLMTNYF